MAAGCCTCQSRGLVLCLARMHTAAVGRERMIRYARLAVTFSSRMACGNVALREAAMHTCTHMDVQTHSVMLNRRSVSDTHMLKRTRATREIRRFFSQPDDRRRGYMVFRAFLRSRSLLKNPDVTSNSSQQIQRIHTPAYSTAYLLPPRCSD